MAKASEERTAELQALAANAGAEEKKKVDAIEAAVLPNLAVTFIDSLAYSVRDALDGLDAHVAKRAAEAEAGEKGLADAAKAVKKFVVENFKPTPGHASYYVQFDQLHSVAAPFGDGRSKSSNIKIEFINALKGFSTLPVVAYAAVVKTANPGADPYEVQQAALSAAQKVARELIDDPVVEDMPRPDEGAALSWYWSDRLDVGKRPDGKRGRWVEVGKKARV